MDKKTIYSQFNKILVNKYRINKIAISEYGKELIFKCPSSIIYEILDELYSRAFNCRLSGESFIITEKLVEEV